MFRLQKGLVISELVIIFAKFFVRTMHYCVLSR